MYMQAMKALTDREMFRHMGRECVAFRVRRASRVVTRIYDRALADAGLTASQLTLLSAVTNRPDMRMAELAEFLGFEPSTLSRSLSALVKKKWLRQSPSSDKRERFFELTDTGREVVRVAFERWRVAQAEVDRIVKGDRDRFTAMLDELAGA
jgi:DNA-binding MarR family transcriptional regulator